MAAQLNLTGIIKEYALSQTRRDPETARAYAPISVLYFYCISISFQDQLGLLETNRGHIFRNISLKKGEKMKKNNSDTS